MNLGENIENDDTGAVFGMETGRLIAKFSHVHEAESFVELINSLSSNIVAPEDEFWRALFKNN